MSPCLFWHFPSFARGQYHRTAPTRKNTKFISLSQHSPACRNLLFDFFYTLRRLLFGQSPYFFIIEPKLE
nr:MAG TPA: hypothetical protein [Caudoviricetes sp.]